MPFFLGIVEREATSLGGSMIETFFSGRAPRRLDRVANTVHTLDRRTCFDRGGDRDHCRALKYVLYRWWYEHSNY
jgi:hypothetical protein